MITDDTPETMGILHMLGMTYMQYGDPLGYTLAELHLLKAYEIGVNLYGRQSAVPSVAATLGSLGENYCRCGKYDNAIKYLESAVAMSRILSEPADSIFMAHNMKLLGDSYREIGQYKSGAKNYYLALSRYIKHGQQLLTTNIFRELCRLYSYAGRFYKSIEFGYIYLKYLRDGIPGQDVDIAWILRFLGMNHMIMGEHSRGRLDLSEAKTIYECVDSNDPGTLKIENGIRQLLSLPLGPTTMVNGIVIPGYTSMMLNSCHKIFLKKTDSKIRPRLENRQMWQYLSDR